jgi:hypothetical protein
MEPELAGLLEQVQAVRERAGKLVDGLDDAAFNWRPQPGVWSVGQCIEHLNVSAEAFFPVIDRALERRLPGRGPFRYGWLERWFLRVMEPPVKMKTRAGKKFQPPADASRDVTLAAFLRRQDQIEERIRRADGLDLERIKVASPVAGFLRYSLGIALQVMVAHERRHLWQAEKVHAHERFPRSHAPA